MAWLKEIPPPLLARRVDEVMRTLGLDPGKTRPCGSVSHGQPKRVSLAAALLNDPFLVVLDEPTAGLDWESRWKVAEAILELRSSRLVVFSTHDLSGAEVMSTGVVLMHGGTVICALDREGFMSGAPSLARAYLGRRTMTGC